VTHTERAGGPLPSNEFAADLAIARGVLRGDAGAEQRFLDEMQCVPLILEDRNARKGRPFDEQELEDLVQETLATVWRRLSDYEGRSSLSTWCFSICMYQMRNALRSKRDAPRPIGEDGEFLLEGACYADLEFDRFEPVYRCLCRLDPRPAEVIQLKFFEDLTFEQIGARLALPENTVKTHFYRGIQRIRSMLTSGTALRVFEESL
jgi:RNA polymerase sigma-70 factor (ECF subfamily)